MHLPYAIILSGGQGTRLWPLTANGIPKAFLSFDNTGISLLKNTILRVSHLLPYERIIIVAGQSHKKELHIHSKDIPDENVILEPTGRGTLPCIGLTALYVKRKDPSSVMIVMPGEQLIKDDKAFQQVITEAVKSAQKHNCVVTLGIKPNFPATRFGYIHIGEKVSVQVIYQFSNQWDLRRNLTKKRHWSSYRAVNISGTAGYTFFLLCYCSI